MATPPGGGGEVPQAGYYPDPSIPGYIRYWNGGAWVPGTSRPAPADGEVPPHPPASAIPAGPILASSPAPAPAVSPATATPAQSAAPVQSAAPAHPAAAVQSAAPAHPAAAVQSAAPVQSAASAVAPAQVQASAHVPAQAQPLASTPASAPVPTVEETGPVFLDEEPLAPEPASAWQADSSRQTGFGGDLDQKVSWGTPRTPDPRTPAEWPVAGGSEPEEERPPAQASPAQASPAPTPTAPASAASASPAPTPAVDPRATGGAARLGGMPVTPIPTPSPAPQPQPQPQPQPAPAPAPTAPAPAAAAPAPAPAPTAPATPSWGQQQPQAQVQPQEQQPVLPWKPPVEDVFQQAARAQAAARPAGLGRRLVARLIDSVVLGALVGAASMPFVTAAVDHIEGKIEAARQSGTTVQVWLLDSTTSVQFGIALASLFVLGVLYEALPTAKWGRTLGKKLCGIEVRDIEAHEPPTFGKALRRWLVYSVLGLLAIGVVNVLWCLFDRPWRQCWHDKAARTFVAR
ncbi:RDD family protein [Streptomyces sp. NPDC006197]|uniref:RDD family protein n=1 Tax=Streptomyces sp. NPDC006197 TaxID=3156685 RepID=UPI0033A22B1E